MDDFLALLNRGIKNSFYIIFFLIPLVLYPKTFELFEFNKLLTLLSISCAILFLWGAKMIVSKKIIFRRTPFDIPILLFLVSQIISTIISIDPHVSLWGYYSRFNGGLISITAYIFLYYAFVSNFLPEKSEQTQKQMQLDEEGMIHTRHLVLAFLSVVVFAVLVSLTQTVPFLQDFFLLLTFVAPCFFFLKAYAYPPLKKLLFMMLSSSAIVALWGFSSHFGYDFTCLLFRGTFDVSCWTDAFQPMVRLFSTLGQPNWLAAYFSVLIPITLALSIYKFTSLSPLPPLKDKKMLPVYCYAALTVLLFIEILWTQSLSGYLGLLSGLFVFFGFIIVFLFIKKGQAKLFKDLVFRLLMVFFAVFFLFAFFLGNPLQERIPSLSFSGIKNAIMPSQQVAKKIAPPATQELGGSDSGKIRLVVWQGAIEIFKKNPLFGTGVETFAYSYYQVKPKAHNLLSEWDFLYNKAHNEYLNYLATTGIFGLGSYLVMIGWFFLFTARWLVKKFDPREFKALLVLSLLSAYITILVSNFFGFSVVVMNLFLFFIPGLVLYITTTPKEPREIVGTMNPMKAIGVLAFGIFCLYLELQLVNLWFADQSYSMGYNLDRVQQYVQANKYLEDAVSIYPSEDLYKSELSLNLATLALLLSQQNRATDGAVFVNRASDLSSRVISAHPKNIVFYKTRVQTLFELSEIDKKYFPQAIETIQRARKLAPTDAKLAYNEGLLYGQKEDIPSAIKTLKESIHLKPNYREPRYALAVYLSQQAKEEKDLLQKNLLLDEARTHLTYILKNIVPGDKQSTELLKSLE